VDGSGAVVRGEFGDDGVSEVLRECERRRITGLLRFVGKGPDAEIEGTIQFFGGELAVDQPARDDGQDPVDLLLDLEHGTWEVDLSLPPLPVSRGTALERTGSLAVHVPVDLMTYCEKAGLTGVLELTHEGRRAEAIYEGGELLAIELDGQDATDLQEVFGWEHGRFKVSIDTKAPDEHRQPEAVEDPGPDGWSVAPATKRENTRQFLRVVEMALVDVLDSSERARSPTRTSPPLPPPPKARPRPPSIPPPKRRREDQTVKLVFLSGERSPVRREEDTESTRHVRSDITAKVEVVSAAPKPSPTNSERKAMAKKRRQKKKGGSGSSTPAEKPKAVEEAVEEEEASEKAESAPKAAPKAAAKTEPASKPTPSGGPPAPEEDTMKPALKQIGEASAWAFAVVLLGVVILYVLGKLPPV